MPELKDLMSRDVQVVNPDMIIGDAARKMRDGDFGMMPVGENDRMIGAITDRDIAIRGVAEGRGAGAKVRDVMSDASRRAR
jgi:predicted transcriptional regulator